MDPIFRLPKRELQRIFEVLEVMHASLDMKEMLRTAYSLLCKLVPADHGALCISRSDDPTLYDWTVAELPDKFFHRYADIAQYDFIRAAVAQKPNIVLRDSDMLPVRRDLERHVLYDYCRSNDMPLEQVMAVMLSSEHSWHGGLMLYRSTRHPFSEQEQQILQFLTPFFANAVVNCKRFTDTAHWASIGETSLSFYRTAVLAFTSSMRLVSWSNGVDKLFDRCFGPDDRGPNGLPNALWRKIRHLLGGPNPTTLPLPWIPPNCGAGLVVNFVPITKNLETHWLVILDEIPDDWRARLTPAEIDVGVRVAQGWDNALVGKELNITVHTVRTHVYRIFNKLGIDNRAVLVARFKGRG